jgi:hypothetical protein
MRDEKIGIGLCVTVEAIFQLGTCAGGIWRELLSQGARLFLLFVEAYTALLV